MALTTAPIAAAVRDHPPGSGLAASVCAVSAGTHAALVVPHVHESRALAVAFALAAVALSLAAVAEATGPSAPVSRTVAALLSAMALAYLLSRTTGLPGLVGRPEPWDPVGVPLASLEAAAALLAVRHPHPRRHR